MGCFKKQNLSWVEESNRQYIRHYIAATHITNENECAKDVRNAKKSTITIKTAKNSA